MKKVQLITDGACLGNPGPGGWAAILIMQVADPGALAVQALGAAVTLGLSLRWISRHVQGQARIAKDRRDAEEKQQQAGSRLTLKNKQTL